MGRHRDARSVVSRRPRVRSEAVRPRAPLKGLRSGSLAPSVELVHYLTRVLRLVPGASFVAFDPEARTEAVATLTTLETGEIALSVAQVQAASVVATRELVLLQGLAKGDKIDAIVRDATELGATRIVLVETARSVVKIEPKKKDERRARLSKIAEEAARQCGRSDPPAIVGPLTLLEAAKLAPEGARFALAPGASRSLGRELLRGRTANEAKAANATAESVALTFAVGPEGGLAEDELVLLESLGFTRVFIGRFVLRTETVAACVLGAVQVLQGQDADAPSGARAGDEPAQAE